MARPATAWGVWASGLRLRETAAVIPAVQALEEMGCSGVWMTGGITNPFARVRELLEATSTMTVATAILSIWTMSPSQVAHEVAHLPAQWQERLILGLGVSHAALVDHADPGRYHRPYTRMREFLTGLDAEQERHRSARVGAEHRVLAALGPKMLQLAGTRAAGAHPYMTTPAHTRQARETMGPAAFLAPTQMVVVEEDPAIARAVARRHLAMYLGQTNYQASWRRLGFTDADIADGGSDRLIDAIVAWGSLEEIVAQAQQHLTAGADHVCLQVFDREKGWQDQPLPVGDWERLFAALPKQSAR